MHTIGFTGGRFVDPVVVYGNLYGIKKRGITLDYKFVTGAALGADTLIGEWLVEEMPIGPTHHIIVPANHDQIIPWWEKNETAIELYDLGYLTVEQMPEGSSYKDRNQAIVDASDELVAFPAFPESHPNARRSGTWQTVRMARRANLPIDIFIAG